MPDGEVAAVVDRQAPRSAAVETPPVLEQQAGVLPESSDTTGEGEGEINLMQPPARAKGKGKKKGKQTGKGVKARDELQEEAVKAEVRCNYEKGAACANYVHVYMHTNGLRAGITDFPVLLKSPPPYGHHRLLFW